MRTINPGKLLKTARREARLSQRALSERAGTAQSVVARIELGLSSPTWSTLETLLEAAGFELSGVIDAVPTSDSHTLDDVARILRLTPEQRLIELRNASRFFAGAERV